MQVSTTVGLQVEILERLKIVSDREHISRNRLMCEGIELVLAKYEPKGEDKQ